MRCGSPNSRPGRRLAAIALGVVLAAGPASLVPVRAEVVEEVAAFVNGQIVTRSELDARLEQVRGQMSRQLSGMDLEAQLNQLKKTMLSDMIRELLLLQRAEIMGLDLDKIFQQSVENLKAQQNIKTNDEFRGLLKQEGIPEDELRTILLRFNVPDIMINLEVRQKIVVAPEEVEAYFNAHRAEFRVEQTYKFREVVILAENHEEGEIEQIATKLEADLAGGLPFNEAVLKYSDAPSRFQEGEVGPLKSEDLAPAIRDELDRLEDGQVSGRIEMRHGLHYVQVEAKTVAKDKTLEEVAGGIEQLLKRERFPKEIESYWQRLYKENRVEVKPIYRVFAEDIPRT
jgi:parvulin-like peptidyl-prolyl isomerase